MTLPEEIKDELSRVDVRTGRPCIGWTDAEWQDYYSLLKLKVKPIKDEKVRSSKLKALYHEPSPSGNTDDPYYGDPLYSIYTNYINSVLTEIRLGNIDYCYYIYQIAELLKREPNLKTRFVNDNLAPYIMVWLEK